MKKHDRLGEKSYALTENLILAIHGAFHTARQVGVQTTPTDIRKAKRSLAIAFRMFSEGQEGVIEAFGSSAESEDALRKVMLVANQIVSKAEKAIKTGVANGASQYLGNTAHGAMGSLVARKAQELNLSARDTAGRSWANPSRLIQTIVRDFHYQKEVDRRIVNLNRQNLVHFCVDGSDEKYTLTDFHKLRPYLFHVNSNLLPRMVNA
jgi:hypothetical protein